MGAPFFSSLGAADIEQHKFEALGSILKAKREDSLDGRNCAIVLSQNR